MHFHTEPVIAAAIKSGYANPSFKALTLKYFFFRNHSLVR